MNDLSDSTQPNLDIQPAATAPQVYTPTATLVGHSRAKVILKSRKALPFYARHPWVLDSAVDWVEVVQTPGEAPLEDLDGQVVDLLNEKRIFVARGYFNSQSRIRIRLMSWHENELLDEAFWRGRIAQAIALRQRQGFQDPANHATSATRLIFSEADGLGGLIVDRYGDYLVLQATSLAVAMRAGALAKVLAELLPQVKGIMVRAEKSTTQLEGVHLLEGLIWGEAPPASLVIEENGLKFALDLTEGQKTGFFLDQRDNRVVAAKYAAGGRVLDMFCYTGGFALAAAAIGGAKEVLAVDGSKKAIAQAESNAQLNGLSNIKFEAADAFDTLEALQTAGEKFDLVVLDPPKFARSRSQAKQALMAYHRVNRAGVNLLRPGGILVTCSCSGTVSREDFLEMLSGVAQKTKRDLQILEIRGAAADHPFMSTCLETEYLKCVICRVL